MGPLECYITTDIDRTTVHVIACTINFDAALVSFSNHEMHALGRRACA